MHQARTSFTRLVLWAFVVLSGALATGAVAQPAPPTNLAATDGLHCDRVGLTWNASSGATSYTVWRSTVNNSGTASQIGSTVSATFNDNAAAVLITYWYWVKAVGPGGTSGFSAGDSGYRAGVPAAPQNLVASDGARCNGVDLTWDGSVGATLYLVLRHTSNNSGAATQIGSTPTTAFADDTAAPGQTYWYWVRASSPCGTSGVGTPDTGQAAPGTAAPQGVTAGDGTHCNWVRVSWNAVPGATLYTIYRSTTTNPQTAQPIGSVGSSPFDDFSAAPGVTYSYWVTATGLCGESNLSARDPGSRPPAPQPATGVNAGNGLSCNVVTVAWDPLPGPTAYAVYRNTTNNTTTAVSLTNTTLTSYQDTSAAPGTVYWYWVRGLNQCGLSAFGTPDTGFRAAVPAPPTGVAASDGTACGRIEVNWNTVTFANDYGIWRNTTNNPGGATLLAQYPAPPFLDESVAPQQVYWYWVTASGVCGQSAQSAPDPGSAASCVPGYTTGFEPPAWPGSPSGVLSKGIDSWFNPLGSGAEFLTFAYAGNQRNFPVNPAGSLQFISGRREGPGLSARIAREISSEGAAEWALAVDFAAHFDGVLPTQSDLGHFGLVPHTTFRGVQARLVWDDPGTAAAFSIVYDVFNAAGSEVAVSPGPAWTGLEPDHWYRAVTAIDFDRSRVTAVALVDLTTGTAAVRTLQDWYMAGGAAPTLPRASLIRLAATGGGPTTPGEGNTVAFDNVSFTGIGYTTGFEPPRYAGSPSGVQTLGQDGWRDFGGGADFRTHTYAGNTLGIIAHPRGESQFNAGRQNTGADNIRMFHGVDLHTADRWNVTFDMAADFDGAPPTTTGVGTFSVAGSANARGVRFDCDWDDRFNPTTWTIRVLAHDAQNGVLIEVPAPAWSGLPLNAWRRIEADLDFAANRIVRLALIDPVTMARSEVMPSGWYMHGGSVGSTERANIVRITVAGQSLNGVGNIAAYDNIVVRPAPECRADCDTSTGFAALDIFDFLCFQNRYSLGDPYACDCDTATGGGPGQPTVCDIFDFLCFQNAYATGCP